MPYCTVRAAKPKYDWHTCTQCSEGLAVHAYAVAALSDAPQCRVETYCAAKWVQHLMLADWALSMLGAGSRVGQGAGAGAPERASRWPEGWRQRPASAQSRNSRLSAALLAPPPSPVGNGTDLSVDSLHAYIRPHAVPLLMGDACLCCTEELIRVPQQ